jgi:hypothetical protein
MFLYLLICLLSKDVSECVTDVFVSEGFKLPEN